MINQSIKIFLISILLLLTVDFLIGKKIFHFKRTYHDVYHHDLNKNIKKKTFLNNKSYFFCTDNNGFKSKCNSENLKKFDLGIIGDSFTEGVGLEYKKTFVGIINSKTELKIANLGVISYSPSIYYKKIKYLLNNGYDFKEIYVFIDISDIQDEATKYYIKNDKVLDRQSNQYIRKIKMISKQSFPLIYNTLREIKYLLINTNKNLIIDENNYIFDKNSYDLDRSAWTYKENVEGYYPLGLENAIKQSITAMEKLYELLKSKNIPLSVAVYPWPGQLLYDNENSKMVKIWYNFCKNKCKNFYNLFPIFFEHANKFGVENTIEEFYFMGDVHFNYKGNKKIANEILKKIKIN